MKKTITIKNKKTPPFDLILIYYYFLFLRYDV